MTTDEKQLLARLKASDKSAYAELVREHSSNIYNLALKMMGDPAEAEEVLQETFLQAVKHIKNFRGQSKLGTWLYRIATNQALMKLRRKQPIKVSLDETDNGLSIENFMPLADWSSRPESELLNQEARQKMEAAIHALPDSLRVVFLLRDIEGLSTAETGETLDLSISAVKSRLLRARLALRSALSDYFAERVSN